MLSWKPVLLVSFSTISWFYDPDYSSFQDFLGPGYYLNSKMTEQTEINRRKAKRQARQNHALLSTEMVQTLNISECGARLLIKNPELRPRMSLMVELAEGEYVGLICEPRWRERIGRNLYVVGVRFPEDQQDLAQLRQNLRRAS